ncbi:hypothetical protein BDW62DRAFT_172978 [Aspergillus aurantiobrunneus]
MGRIQSMPMARGSLARRLLGWIMHAMRRLKLHEVFSVFAVAQNEERTLIIVQILILSSAIAMDWSLLTRLMEPLVLWIPLHTSASRM